MTADRRENDGTGRMGAAGFATTHWSMVLAAGDPKSGEAGDSLKLLCERYWFPLYGFVRRSGYSPADAQDFTQDFFAHMLNNQILEGANPEKGKFRAFLIACMKNLLSDKRRRANAQKRGGGCQVLSLDYKDAEGRYQLDPGHNLTPEHLFDRRWAQALLQRVVELLREEWEVEGKASFDDLKVYLVDGKGAKPHADLAPELGITVTNLKTKIHRLRKRYADLIHKEIADTVSDPSKIEEEIRHLLEALEQ